MGKGDKRTKRGKIWRGSYGRLRHKEHKEKEQPATPPTQQKQPAR